jgi:hypothetical protein
LQIGNIVAGVDDPGTTIQLSLQLLVAGGLVFVMVISHTLGLLGISRLLRLKSERLLELHMDARAVLLVGAMGLLVVMLHIAEIFIFAAFYLLVDAHDSLADALFTSAAAYSTIGLSHETFPEAWRLIGALEGLVGFVLIGWSTAFMVRTLNKLND